MKGVKFMDAIIYLISYRYSLRLFVMRYVTPWIALLLIFYQIFHQDVMFRWKLILDNVSQLHYYVKKVVQLIYVMIKWRCTSSNLNNVICYILEKSWLPKVCLQVLNTPYISNRTRYIHIDKHFMNVQLSSAKKKVCI